MEELLKMIQDMMAQMEAMKAQLVGFDASLAEAKKASYDEGYAAGVEMMKAGAKLYTEEEMSAKIAEAIAPLDAKIKEMELAMADFQGNVNAAVAAVKVELLAKLEAMDAAQDEAVKALFQ